MADANSHMLGTTSASPPSSPTSSSSTLSSEPDNLPETWEEHVNMARRAAARRAAGRRIPDRRVPGRRVRGAAKVDESSATLSDANNVNTDDDNIQSRMKQIAIAQWRPESDQDPWKVRSGTKEHPAEDTTAAIQLYDKVEGGSPSNQVFNNPTARKSLEACFGGILFNKRGRKIDPVVPKYLREYNKTSDTYVMPDRIPTTGKMDPVNMSDNEVEDGWEGYLNYDGSEMDVLSVINEFSVAARAARGGTPFTGPRQDTTTQSTDSSQMKHKERHRRKDFTFSQEEPEKNVLVVETISSASHLPVPAITIASPGFHVPDSKNVAPQATVVHQSAAPSNIPTTQQVKTSPREVIPEAVAAVPRMTARQAATLPRQMTARQATIASLRAVAEEPVPAQGAINKNKEDRKSYKKRHTASQGRSFRGQRAAVPPRAPEAQQAVVAQRTAGNRQVVYRAIAPRPEPGPSMATWSVEHRRTIAEQHFMIVAPQQDEYQSPYGSMPNTRQSNVRGEGSSFQNSITGESSVRSTNRPKNKTPVFDPDETEDDMDMVERSIGFTRTF